MNQTRMQRHYQEKAFYKKNWFWLLILTGLLLSGFISSHYWQQNRLDHLAKTTLKQPQQRTHKSKLQKNTDRFQKDRYTTADFVLTLTGGKMTADENSNPVLLIEYHFKNRSDHVLTPKTVWSNYAQVTQQKAELAITKRLLADLPESDQAQYAATQQPVDSGQTCDGTIAFTLVNKKDIVLKFLDTKTHKPLGTKQYKLTE